MNTIILDTNILMAIPQFKIDIFTELERLCDFPYQITILDRTIDELESIKTNQKGKDKLAASIALQLIKKKNIDITTTSQKKLVDDILVDFSHQGSIIATQDMALKRKLKKPYITLRKKKYLIIIS